MYYKGIGSGLGIGTPLNQKTWNRIGAKENPIRSSLDKIRKQAKRINGLLELPACPHISLYLFQAMWAEGFDRKGVRWDAGIIFTIG